MAAFIMLYADEVIRTTMIERDGLIEIESHRFVTEASTLGWRPGFFPQVIAVKGNEVGNGLAFAIEYRDESCSVYAQHNGVAKITVFND
jgi:hypothetical protein